MEARPRKYILVTSSTILAIVLIGCTNAPGKKFYDSYLQLKLLQSENDLFKIFGRNANKIYKLGKTEHYISIYHRPIFSIDHSQSKRTIKFPGELELPHGSIGILINPNKQVIAFQMTNESKLTVVPNLAKKREFKSLRELAKYFLIQA